MKINQKKGFTLIELMVVIAIIGLLSTIVVASLSTVRKKARDTKRVADIKSLQLAMELYFDSNRQYPYSLAALVPAYIPNLPKDPVSGGDYSFSPLNAGCTGYHLGANLEDNTNPAVVSGDTDAAAGTLATGCSGTVAGAVFAGGGVVTCGGALGTDACYDITN